MKEFIELLKSLKETDGINLKEFWILLTPIERTVLKILAAKKKPLTTNDIRNAMIEDFEPLIEYYGKNSTPTDQTPPQTTLRVNPMGGVIKPINKRITEQSKSIFWKYEFDIGYKKKPKPIFWQDDFEDDPEIFKRIYEETKTITPKYLQKRKRGELLKKYGIADIPAFATIERILKEFAAMGFVLSREEVTGRGKKLWVINPKLLEFFENTKKT